MASEQLARVINFRIIGHIAYYLIEADPKYQNLDYNHDNYRIPLPYMYYSVCAHVQDPEDHKPTFSLYHVGCRPHKLTSMNNYIFPIALPNLSVFQPCCPSFRSTVSNLAHNTVLRYWGTTFNDDYSYYTTGSQFEDRLLKGDGEVRLPNHYHSLQTWSTLTLEDVCSPALILNCSSDISRPIDNSLIASLFMIHCSP